MRQAISECYPELASQNDQGLVVTFQNNSTLDTRYFHRKTLPFATKVFILCKRISSHGINR